MDLQNNLSFSSCFTCSKQNLVLEILFILSVIPHYLVATCTRVRQELHMQSHGFHNYDY